MLSVYHVTIQCCRANVARIVHGLSRSIARSIFVCEHRICFVCLRRSQVVVSRLVDSDPDCPTTGIRRYLAPRQAISGPEEACVLLMARLPSVPHSPKFSLLEVEDFVRAHLVTAGSAGWLPRVRSFSGCLRQIMRSGAKRYRQMDKPAPRSGAYVALERLYCIGPRSCRATLNKVSHISPPLTILPVFSWRPRASCTRYRHHNVVLERHHARAFM